MAVYTPVSGAQLSAWLRHFPVGALESFEGIVTGVENTNYFVTTSAGQFVLTLFERLDVAHAQFYLDFMAHLSQREIPCPNPVLDNEQHFLRTLNDKPATLVTRLTGRSEMTPRTAHCREIGGALARMHLASVDFPESWPNPRGPLWWAHAAPRVMPHLPNDERALLEEELRYQAASGLERLPHSVVHADLFRDNALWSEGKLTGIIDFYFAGADSWLFDLAVTANDWCLDARADFDDARLRALLQGYEQTRRMSAEERALWPAALRRAALRFWLSRLDDLHAPRPGELLKAHDPNPFRDILRRHVAKRPAWPSA
jgi:homoserine kinase type II